MNARKPPGNQSGEGANFSHTEFLLKNSELGSWKYRQFRRLHRVRVFGRVHLETNPAHSGHKHLGIGPGLVVALQTREQHLGGFDLQEDESAFLERPTKSRLHDHRGNPCDLEARGNVKPDVAEGISLAAHLKKFISSGIIDQDHRNEIGVATTGCVKFGHNFIKIDLAAAVIVVPSRVISNDVFVVCVIFKVKSKRVFTPLEVPPHVGDAVLVANLVFFMKNLGACGQVRGILQINGFGDVPEILRANLSRRGQAVLDGLSVGAY
jgi:hypothetical protein